MRKIKKDLMYKTGIIESATARNSVELKIHLPALSRAFDHIQHRS